MTIETTAPTPQQVKDEAVAAVQRFKLAEKRADARRRALRRAGHAAALAAKDLGARDEELAEALEVGVGMVQKVIAEQRLGGSADL